MQNIFNYFTVFSVTAMKTGTSSSSSSPFICQTIKRNALITNIFDNARKLPIHFKALYARQLFIGVELWRKQFKKGMSDYLTYRHYYLTVTCSLTCREQLGCQVYHTGEISHGFLKSFTPLSRGGVG